ncbi:MAG: DNA-processing protein DprA [Terriglobales bacterium]
MEAESPAAGASLAQWLGLALTPGLGQRGLHNLFEHFSSAEEIYAASLTELEGCGLAVGVARQLHDGRALALGAEEAGRAERQGVEVVSRADRRYPELLREIFDAPVALYVRGDAAALDTFGVALVGTRHPTIYGKLMAEKLGRELAQWGLTVFSGMARGVDGDCQRACLEAGGRTVAVLGSGVDIIYPSEHEKLAEQIMAGTNGRRGALVSELPLGAPPAPQNFPIRNRIISGMALGVVVIEGGEYSGSRITARMALEQDREVFAVPGMATQKQAWLPNALIKQGAKLVTGAADVIEELPSAVRGRLDPPPVMAVTLAAAANGEGAEPSLQAKILNVLAVDDTAQVDEIGNRMDNSLTAPELLAALFDLELEGKIRQLPGKKYLRVS